MKILSALTLMLFFSFTALAKDWVDIEVNGHYVLNQTISFPGIAEFHAGDKFEATDFIAGGVPVVYYEMHSNDCKNPNLEAEMIILNPNPEDTSTDRSVAVDLEKGCILGVWVEIKDLYSKGLFEDDSSLR